MTYTELKALKDLAIHAIKGTIPADAATEFTVVDVNDSFQKEIGKLAVDFNAYRRNKLDIFEIVQAMADEVVPNRVIAAMGTFAEIRRVANGQRTQFIVKKGRNRAKQFLTRVGLSGVYEAFRLDSDTYDVTAMAYGGAAYIDFERFLCGQESLAEPMQIIIDGLGDKIFDEVQSALQAAVSATRPANTIYSSTYSADELFKLINVVKAYGTGAIIYASSEFVASMGADAVTVGTGSVAADSDINDIHNTGYVTTFRGTPIVRMPQSFTDETNATKVISPDYAYIFPTGGEKVVKIVLEGNTVVTDWTNRDNSMEIQAYMKFGVAIHTYHNWAIYYNAALT